MIVLPRRSFGRSLLLVLARGGRRAEAKVTTGIGMTLGEREEKGRASERVVRGACNIGVCSRPPPPAAAAVPPPPPPTLARSIYPSSAKTNITPPAFIVSEEEEEWRSMMMAAMICGREGHSGSAAGRDQRGEEARKEAPGPQMDFENE